MKKKLFALFLTPFLYLLSTLLPFAVWADVQSPSDWLDAAAPSGIVHGKPFEYLTGTVIPFLIYGLVWLVMIASLFFVIIGGIRWMLSGGEKQAVAAARGTVTWAIVGLSLALSSFLILGLLSYILNFNGGFGLPLWKGTGGGWVNAPNTGTTWENTLPQWILWRINPPSPSSPPCTHGVCPQ